MFVGETLFAASGLFVCAPGTGFFASVAFVSWIVSIGFTDADVFLVFDVVGVPITGFLGGTGLNAGVVNAGTSFSLGLLDERAALLELVDGLIGDPPGVGCFGFPASVS